MKLRFYFCLGVCSIIISLLAGGYSVARSAEETALGCSDIEEVDLRVFHTDAAVDAVSPDLGENLLSDMECLEARATRVLAREAVVRGQLISRITDVVDAHLAGERDSNEVRPDSQIRKQIQQWEELLSTQQAIDTAIENITNNLYSSVRRIVRSSINLDERHILALSLFDYTRLIRSAYRTTAQTEVNALKNDPSCRGDLIIDRVLWRYFQNTLVSHNSTTSRAAAVKNLGTIAAQTACMGTQQLYRYDLALTLAWYRLRDRLARHDLHHLMDKLAAIVLQPRLLVFDATKHHGLQSPGYLWLKDQANLRNVLAERRVWPLDQRLWLYDRTTGNLAALRTACAGAGTGRECISLGVLFESLTNPLHLGFGECSVLEMLEAGVRDIRGAPGYTCTPSVCGTPHMGELPETFLGASFLGAVAAIDANLTAPSAGARGTTPFGVAVGEARGQLCGSGGLGGNGADGGRCGMSAGGMGRTNNAIAACILKARDQEPAVHRPNLTCLTRALGQCPDPQAPLREVMTPVFFDGVPMCQLATDGGIGGGGSTNAEDIKDAAGRMANDIKNNALERENIKNAFEGALGVRPTDQQLDRAADKLANATPVPTIDAGAANAETDIFGNIAVAEDNWDGRSEASQGRTLQHEYIHSLANIMSQDKSINPTTEAEDQEIMRRVGLNLDAKLRCDQDNPECINACNGMSQQMQQALACVNDAFGYSRPTVPPSVAPIDPLPDDVSAPAWSLCLAPADHGAAAVTQCSLVRCANPGSGINSITGACCEAGGLPIDVFSAQNTRGICQFVLCAPDTATEGGLGMCGCGGSFIGPAEPQPSISTVPIEGISGVPDLVPFPIGPGGPLP